MYIKKGGDILTFVTVGLGVLGGVIAWALAMRTISAIFGQEKD